METEIKIGWIIFIGSVISMAGFFLMVLMFVFGVMNIAAMLVLTIVIAVEKRQLLLAMRGIIEGINVERQLSSLEAHIRTEVRDHKGSSHRFGYFETGAEINGKSGA